MKTAILIFFLAVALTDAVLAQQTPVPTEQATVTAQETAVKPAPSQGFEVDVNGGYSVGGNFALSTEYPEGGGGGAAILFPVANNFSLGLMGGFYTYGQSTSTYEIETFTVPSGTVTVASAFSETTQSAELMLAAKYYFDENGIKPYVFGGAGIADYSLTEIQSSVASGSAPSTTTTAISSQIDPMFTAGFGLNFPIGNDLGIFLQGKESFILVPTTSITTSNAELSETGTVGGVVSDTTFEGGLSFDIR